MTRKALGLSIGIAFALAVVTIVYLRWPQGAWVLHLAKGQRLSYVLSYQSEGRGQVDFGSDFLQGSDSGKLEEVLAELKGKLDLEVIEAEGERVKAKFSFSPESFVLSLGHQSLPPPQTSIDGTIELGLNGSVRSVEFRADQHKEYGQIVLDIFTLLEMKLPEGSKSPWKGEEISATRSIAVLWQRLSSDDKGDRLVKRYQDPHVSGEARFHLDTKSHAWVEMQGERSRRFFLRGRLVSEDKTTITLVTSQPQKALPTVASNLVKDNLKAETLRKVMLEQTYRDQLGSTSEAEVHTGLDTLTTGTSAEAYRKLKGYLFLFPEKTQGFRQALLEYKREDPRFGTLTMALTAVGDAEAQKLLRDAIEASEGLKKQELIPHLAFVDHPDVLSEAYLKELAQSAAEPMIRDTAELGLGILAHQLRGKEPERARKILIQLNDKLLAASDAKSKIQTLNAMGNIGLSEQMDSTLPFTKDPDPKIRAAALQSLRYVPEAEVSNLLAAAVAHDPETRVREEASEALTYVPPTDGDLARYEAILFSETNFSVLKNVLRVLANTGSPAAKTLMQKFLDNCGRTEVCGYADSLIRGL